MIAENLINPMIPAVKREDKAEKAIIWMEEFKTNQLPVIDGRNYLGLITEDIILDGNNLDRLIGDFQLYAENCYIFDWQHLFEVVKLMQKCDAEMAAIVDEQKQFQGVATYEDVVKAFANTITIQGMGGILVISMKHIDYSMAELSRLIEAEGSKIIGSLIGPHPTESDKLYLTLKLNTEDLTAITALLERFNYTVAARFHQPANLENERERLDNLLKYLDI
jgi:CBS domain-containing protein